MRIQKLLLSVFLILCGYYSFGQKEWSNWYFYPRTLFTFSNNNIPEVKTNFINPVPDYWYSYYYSQNSGTAYADPVTGKTRFLLAGRWVYDKNYDLIASSFDLRACPGDDYSFHIIPFQNNPDKFYIIQFQDLTADLLAAESGLQVRCPNAIGLGYSILDLSLNNGLGEITSKNNVLSSGIPHGITLVRHANGKDTWVVVHGWNNNEFHSFLFSDNGVTGPVTSAIGPVISRSSKSIGGTLSASHNGRIIAAQITGTDELDLYDFDNSTGQLKSFKRYHTGYPADRMVFSPDDTKLYYLGSYYAPGVYQLDLDVPDVQASLTKIADDPYKSMYQMQLGPDGRIYIGGLYQLVGYNYQYYLPVINCPNLAKYACNYDAEGFKLPLNHSYGQFPKLINDFIQQPKAPRATEFSLGNDTAICFGTFKISAPEGWQYYKWNTGETTREISVSTPGIYYVLAGDLGFSCPTAFGSINITNAAEPLNLGKDTILCPGTSYTIQVPQNFSNLLWSDGTTMQDKVVTTGNNYSLIAKDQNGCTNWDTISVGFWSDPRANFGKDTTLCDNQTLLLQMEPRIYPGFPPAATYLWQDGSVKDSFRVKEPGTYWGKIIYQGCTVSDTIKVAYVNAQEVSLGADTTICVGDSLDLKVAVPDAQVLWSTGETGQQIAVRSSGNYWVRVNNGTCTVTDTIQVGFQPKPSVYLGKDTVLCAGQKITLTPALSNGALLWQNGSLDNNFEVKSPGLYWAKATVNGCSNTDSIEVSYKLLPILDLGKDTSICNGETLSIDASDPSIQSYKWNDGSTQPALLVRAAGIYSVEVVGTNGCAHSDLVEVRTVFLPQFTLGKDTVLCEGKHLELDLSLAGGTYLWSTGSRSNAISITQPGLYWVDVRQNGCSKRDSLEVSYKPLPLVSLGADTTLCEGFSKLLDATNNNASYQWQDQSVLPTYVVDKAGTYHVAVNMNGCIGKDTIRVEYNYRPQFSLGRDTSLCIGMELRLDPRISNASLLWQDGSTAPLFVVKELGMYRLTATNDCGSSSDQIQIVRGVCSLWMPNAFTPNRDGLNDIFRVKEPGFIQTFSMLIYNRWGEIIYRTDNPGKGWDGTYKGLPQPEGNYIWQISLVTKEGEKVEAKGGVLLVR